MFAACIAGQHQVQQLAPGPQHLKQVTTCKRVLKTYCCMAFLRCASFTLFMQLDLLLCSDVLASLLHCLPVLPQGDSGLSCECVVLLFCCMTSKKSCPYSHLVYSE